MKVNLPIGVKFGMEGWPSMPNFSHICAAWRLCGLKNLTIASIPWQTVVPVLVLIACCQQFYFRQINLKKNSDVYGHEHVVCKTRYNCFLATPSNIGLLRKPSEGQSLLSFLSSQDFHTCTDLDRVYFKCTFILFDSLYVGICMLCILCMLPSHSHHVIMF